MWVCHCPASLFSYFRTKIQKLFRALETVSPWRWCSGFPGAPMALASLEFLHTFNGLDYACGLRAFYIVTSSPVDVLIIRALIVWYFELYMAFLARNSAYRKSSLVCLWHNNSPNTGISSKVLQRKKVHMQCQNMKREKYWLSKGGVKEAWQELGERHTLLSKQRTNPLLSLNKTILLLIRFLLHSIR